MLLHSLSEENHTNQNYLSTGLTQYRNAVVHQSLSWYEKKKSLLYRRHYGASKLSYTTFTTL
jgi:hypothetical protein